jgi:hypothetical protein
MSYPPAILRGIGFRGVIIGFLKVSVEGLDRSSVWQDGLYGRQEIENFAESVM